MTADNKSEDPVVGSPESISSSSLLSSSTAEDGRIRVPDSATTTAANEAEDHEDDEQALASVASLGRRSMNDSPSVDDEQVHLPPRLSLEESLSNEPTQLLSEVSGLHPEDLESNDPLPRLEEAEAELVI